MTVDCNFYAFVETMSDKSDVSLMDMQQQHVSWDQILNQLFQKAYFTLTNEDVAKYGYSEFPN